MSVLSKTPAKIFIEKAEAKARIEARIEAEAEARAELNEAKAKVYQEKLNSIITMLNDLPDDKIALYTNMSIEEIAKIREECSK